MIDDASAIWLDNARDWKTEIDEILLIEFIELKDSNFQQNLEMRHLFVFIQSNKHYTYTINLYEGDIGVRLSQMTYHQY